MTPIAKWRAKKQDRRVKLSPSAHKPRSFDWLHDPALEWMNASFRVLAAKLSGSKLSFDAIADAFDPTRDEKITIAAFFHTAAEAWKRKLTGTQRRALWRRIDKEGKGYVSVPRFIRFISKVCAHFNYEIPEVRDAQLRAACFLVATSPTKVSTSVKDVVRRALVWEDDEAKAMETAIQDDNIDKVKALIKTGVSANVTLKDGKTALICAAESGNAATVESLLLAGANPELKDAEGKTALDLVKGFSHDAGYARIIALLNGTEPLRRDSEEEKSDEGESKHDGESDDDGYSYSSEEGGESGSEQTFSPLRTDRIHPKYVAQTPFGDKPQAPLESGRKRCGESEFLGLGRDFSRMRNVDQAYALKTPDAWNAYCALWEREDSNAPRDDDIPTIFHDTSGNERSSPIKTQVYSKKNAERIRAALRAEAVAKEQRKSISSSLLASVAFHLASNLALDESKSISGRHFWAKSSFHRNELNAWIDGLPSSAHFTSIPTMRVASPILSPDSHMISDMSMSFSKHTRPSAHSASARARTIARAASLIGMNLRAGEKEGALSTLHTRLFRKKIIGSWIGNQSQKHRLDYCS